MDKNKSNLERHFKVISIFLCLNFLLFSSCEFNSKKNMFSTSRSDINTSLISQKSEPEIIVQKFMNYISDGNLEAANNLVISEKERVKKEYSKNLDSYQELPSKFDWAKVFKDDKLSLKKIEGNEVIQDTAKVSATVIYDNDSRITMVTIFDLKKINDQWFIYDIKFKTDKDQSLDKFL